MVASYVLSGTRYGQPKKGDNGGGHAVVLINLIQERQNIILKFMNSWGMEWNGDGTFEISWYVFQDPQFQFHVFHIYWTESDLSSRDILDILAYRDFRAGQRPKLAATVFRMKRIVNTILVRNVAMRYNPSFSIYCRQYIQITIQQKRLFLFRRFGSANLFKIFVAHVYNAVAVARMSDHQNVASSK